jgi:hypothetical protein
MSGAPERSFSWMIAQDDPGPISVSMKHRLLPRLSGADVDGDIIDAPASRSNGGD